MNNKDLKFVFFGTDDFSVNVLDELKSAEFIPQIIVTAPDRPAGRGQKMTKPVAKIWAEEKSIKILQPEKLDDEFIKNLGAEKWDIFAVASYGKIIPDKLIEIPEKGALNVHPSLIPLYRGASPIESAILDDARETGVTIIKMDEKMDHGPILNQEFVFFKEWPTKIEVEEKLAKIGGALLAKNIPAWINGEVDEQEQDHDMATFTKKITKEDGEIEIDQNGMPKNSRKNFLKIQALNPWPGAYFFINKNGQKMRIKITQAVWENGSLKIERVIPEGKKEMDWEAFINFSNK